MNIIDLSVKINTFNCKASIFNNNVISDIEVSRDGCIFIIKKYTIDPIPKGNKIQEFIYLKSENTSPKKVQVLEKIKMNNDKPLSEAKIVVSAGRGLKSSENWEMVEKLASLLNAATACSKPVSDLGWRPHSEHVGQTGIKISPDIDEKEISNIIEIINKYKIDGVIISNTTNQNREKLLDSKKSEIGGLSGQPIKNISTNLIKKFYKELNTKITIIGVGGVDSGESAFEKIAAGADVIQLYTGMIYRGPGTVKEIKKELISILKKDKIKNISDAVGINA